MMNLPLAGLMATIKPSGSGRNVTEQAFVRKRIGRYCVCQWRRGAKAGAGAGIAFASAVRMNGGSES